MKRLKQIFQIIIVAIVLTSTAYSQQVRSSFFSLNQVEASGKNIIRSYMPTGMLITGSHSGNMAMFAFIKNSDVLNYTTLPSNYSINDFVVLDSCIYFCGKNTTKNCGYIGMFNVPTPYLGIGAYTFIDIDSSANLTKLVAYNGTISSTVGVAAIGTPKNTSFKSCVVDLNNYSGENRRWKYQYAQVAKEEITDICDATPDFLVTIGKSNTTFMGSLVLNHLCLRRYKKSSVLGSNIKDESQEYSLGTIPYNSDSFLIEPIGGDNIAVVGLRSLIFEVVRTASPHTAIIMKIDVNTLVLNAQQTLSLDGDEYRTLHELEYFPSENILGIALRKGDNNGEFLFADMTQTQTYTSSKLWKDNYIFNSITRSNNNNFALSCTQYITSSPCLYILQDNLNAFQSSNCSANATIDINATTQWDSPTMRLKSFSVQDRVNASIVFEPASIYETTVDVHCIDN